MIATNEGTNRSQRPVCYTDQNNPSKPASQDESNSKTMTSVLNSMPPEWLLATGAIAGIILGVALKRGRS